MMALSSNTLIMDLIFASSISISSHVFKTTAMLGLFDLPNGTRTLVPISISSSVLYVKTLSKTLDFVSITT